MTDNEIALAIAKKKGARCFRSKETGRILVVPKEATFVDHPSFAGTEIEEEWPTDAVWDPPPHQDWINNLNATWTLGAEFEWSFVEIDIGLVATCTSPRQEETIIVTWDDAKDKTMSYIRARCLLYLAMDDQEKNR